MKVSNQIILMPDINPIIVNSTHDCVAAYLYTIDKKVTIFLVGSIGEISPDELYNLIEEEVYVVDSYKNQVRLITYNTKK
ncbi:hypothetical protein F7888_12910 [Bacillus sp. PS06]|nr:hypothetical protein [Bacillus sp. PS06]MBD8069858.1 hypothetical protein [Bacillus sp. PS06]